MAGGRWFLEVLYVWMEVVYACMEQLYEWLVGDGFGAALCARLVEDGFALAKTVNS